MGVPCLDMRRMISFPNDVATDSRGGAPSVSGVPLACPRAMRLATLTVPTPFAILGTMLMALLAVPRGAMMAPALLRTKHHRRA
jgi:hypothetical protein